MKIFTVDELKNILELHQKWLDGDENGIAADLRGANGDMSLQKDDNAR
jgi:hypothetical protein